MANISQINGSLINASTASLATTATTANTASKITVTNIDATNATYYPVFVDAQTGARQAATDSGFTFNSFTNAIILTGGSINAFALTATTITGSLQGNTVGTASYATVASQSGYTMQFVLATSGSNPAANTTYRWGAAVTNLLNTTSGRRRIYVPRPGTVRYAHIYVRVNGTLATAGQTSTFRIDKNSSISQLINTSTTAGSTADVAISSTALTMSVIQGDYLEIQWQTPSGWSTTPTAVECNAIIFIEQNS